MLKNTVIKYLDDVCNRQGMKNKPALISETKCVTFAEYQQLSKQIASYIINLCKNNNVPIVVYLPKSINTLLCFMGILYSGNYYCPIAFGSPEDRIKSIMQTLDFPYIITDKENQDFVCQFTENSNRILLIEEALTSPIEEEQIKLRIENVIDTDPVYVLFTSGSTGVPKGVILPHRAIIDYINWSISEFNLDHNISLVSQAPFHFDASMPDIFTPIFTGGTLHIVPEKFFMFPIQLVDYINQNNINTLIWVPSALMTLTNKKVVDHKNMPTVKLIMFCGEVMPNKHLNILRKALPNTEFVNLYGPTEAAYACTYYRVKRSFHDDEALPIGKACRNTRIFLIDKEDNPIDKINQIGEICISGSCLALGYWGQPLNTSFVVNPSNKFYSEMVYKSGDLGQWNNRGELIYLGRKDNQIKHLGYRIELGEIETAVQSLSGIRNSCVLYNINVKEIVLFYEADNTITKFYIVKCLQNKIPKYMFPTIFYRFDEMPLNVNGKIDRVLLKQNFIDKENTTDE